MKKMLLTLSLLVSNLIHAQGFFPAKTAYSKVRKNKAVFIDVRTQPEIEGGIIKGAVWIPLSKIQEDPKAIAKILKTKYKDKEVFIYCRSGGRSEVAKGLLESSGVDAENVGGFSILKENGVPFTK